jgi:hypothetical protein
VPARRPKAGGIQRCRNFERPRQDRASSTDVAEIYEACAADAQTRTGGFLSAEPFLNYQKTRQAQFLVVEGRALIAIGNLAGGMQAMRDARRVANYVANWQPESIGWETTGRANFTNSGSMRVNVATDDTGVRAPVDASTAQRNTDRQGSRYQAAALEIRAAAEEVLVRVQSLHLGATPN